ncbi:hypothetical protein ACTA71_010845 [Dictyostelium dimigraforme]
MKGVIELINKRETISTKKQQQSYNPTSPTMTIHTKRAFHHVMAMFSEPLEFEKNKKSTSSTKLNNVQSSPNPFTESTLVKSTTHNKKNNNPDVSFYEKLIEDQENIDPNQGGNPLLSSKIQIVMF